MQVSKSLRTLSALLMTGTSTLRLTAEEIQAAIKDALPMHFENGIITTVEVSFVPENDLMQITLKGSLSGMVNAFPYRCGFGFATVGTVYYNQERSALFFKPVSFGAISIAPGEGMVVVEPVINLAANVTTAVYGGVKTGLRSVGRLVGKGTTSVRDRLVPSVIRRAGGYMTDTIGSGVTKVTDKVGEGVDMVQGLVSHAVLSAARAFLEYTPIYAFQNDNVGRHAKALVHDIKIEKQELVVTLSVHRHQTLRFWHRIALGVLVTAIIAGGVMYFLN